MPRKKKPIKQKEPVRLRMKPIANGNQSLYLDIYRDGKRSYEFLKLYIVPERTAQDRTANENTMKLAEAVKARRIVEMQNNEHGFSNTFANSRMLLTDWMRHYAKKKLEKGQSPAFSIQIGKAIKYLIKYRGDQVTMKDVDKEYCSGFIDFLNATSMSKVTTAGYFRCLNCGLNAAVKEDIIPFNPITKIPSEDRIKMPESTREYLTIEEIKLLAASDCKHEEVKRAYLFSCLCGLRLSDVKALRWKDLNNDDGQWRATVLMKKTQKYIYLPLSAEAVKWLPERRSTDDSDTIFHLPSDGYLNRLLQDWASECGIRKHVTFHTARHSNATMLLTLGADVYTVSKLLGHTQIKTTQIYAKIVDKKKDEAVNLIPSLT